MGGVVGGWRLFLGGFVGLASCDLSDKAGGCGNVVQPYATTDMLDHILMVAWLWIAHLYSRALGFLLANSLRGIRQVTHSHRNARTLMGIPYRLYALL